ncbi:LPD29 domain-containing protein [Anoxybacillus flavithermus]|uniref:Large polyvalent protein associated domain-containing protein n=1 Tax=Anoxybacillus flavithermus TaxID=33934 RepID=A0A178TMB3_9BACL|nr:LPD29 domain-containing protein [Anoxybacillus flavithermus]OAO82615.1 hypothetical protein TAF16_0235 [Anoxybacillus flavithermus]
MMNTKETAKKIRQELKEKFPFTKFSVRCERSGSINVSWTDFPTERAVEDVVSKYEQVQRCEVTGEILSGGNLFVFTCQTWTEEMKKKIETEVRNNYGESYLNDRACYYRAFNETAEKMYQEYLETLENQKEASKQTKKTQQEQQQADVKATYTLNEELNGIEITFNTVPSEEVRNELKTNGFRWSKYKKVWYAKQTAERLEFAKMLAGEAKEQTEEVTELAEATQECEHHETLADAYNVHKSLIDLIATNRQFNDTLRMTDLKPYVVILQNAYYDVKENNKYSFVQSIDVYNAVNALQNSELFNILKSEYITGSEHDNTQQAEERKEAQESINIDNNQQENEQEVFSIIPKVQENALNLQFFSNPTSSGDVLNLFDNIDLTQEKTLISDEDREHINKLEESYRATLSVFENHLQQLQELHGQYGDYFDVTEETFSFLRGDVHEIEKRIECLKSDFISKICRYFTKKYNITIDYESIRNKYNTLVTSQEIISEIIEQLDGFSFIEKAQQEIKSQLQKETSYIKTKVKNNKISLNNFFYIDSFEIQFGKYKISYNSYDRAIILFKALYLFDSGAINLSEELKERVKSLRYSENNNVFTTHELNMKKIKSIKLYKNGRVDIEFTSSHYAREFAKDFLNIVKAA